VIWNLETGEIATEFDGPPTTLGLVSSRRLSPDFQYYAYAVYEDAAATQGNLTITELETDSSISIEVNNGFSSLHWSPDSTQIAVVGEESIILLDAKAGDEIDSFDTHGRIIRSGVVWTNGELRWASVDSNNHLRVWQSNLDNPLFELPEQYSSDSARFLPTDAELVADSQIWNIESGEAITVENLPVSNGIWSPDGTCVAAGFVRLNSDGMSHYIGIWDTTQQEMIYELEIPTSVETTRIAWSPDSSRIAIGADDGVVRVWGIPSSP
jgi:WD40 repeat protein